MRCPIEYSIGRTDIVDTSPPCRAPPIVQATVAEIAFPPGVGADRRGHVHGRVEVLDVLSGRLVHIVNGQSHVLEPGRVAVVRPGDQVVHRVIGEDAVRALVIWAPGGELERLRPFFRERRIEPERNDR